MTTGKITNIQRFSIHDGPGIRTTVFFKGCPLSCVWCHNPETRDSDPVVLRTESRCIRCGACITTCPEGTADNLSEQCVRCGACVQACPSGARELVGREMTVPELTEQIARDRVFYDESGGGLTVSGGEPLAQPDFLLGLLKSCRKNGIHTYIIFLF